LLFLPSAFFRGGKLQLATSSCCPPFGFSSCYSSLVFPGIAKNSVNKTVRGTASKKLFGFAELGRSHKEKSTSVDERNYYRRDVGTPRLGADNLNFSDILYSVLLCYKSALLLQPAAFLCYFLWAVTKKVNEYEFDMHFSSFYFP
jgi:hypothetical protein